MRHPSFDDHRTFCRVDEWSRKADKPGRTVSKHEVWTKVLRDGSVLRTSISKGRGEYGPGLFTRILRQQLRVTADEFWLVVDRGERPERDAAKERASTAVTVPLKALLRLRAMGYSDAEIRALSGPEIERLAQED
jgi:hypothetical protein